MNDGLTILEVDEDYINLLRKQDNRILLSKNRRKYVGILFDVIVNGGILHYVAPITSPKEKHVARYTLDYHEIAKGLGGININNMIPVPSSKLKQYSINQETDSHYRILLWRQYRTIQTQIQLFATKAAATYDIVTNPKNTHEDKGAYIVRCCDFKRLEDKALDQINR